MSGVAPSRRYVDASGLGPDIGLLGDERVIIQSWKKSHEYIRIRNWYSDPLELDVSAVKLRSLVAGWRELVTSGRIFAYTPDSVRLVLAPKSGRWGFNGEGWGPRETLLDVRPLAHLSVQDQTLGTGLLVCLANLLETEQGDPDPKDGSGEVRTTASYGNRLVCDFQAGIARFRWMNSECYRKYYVDYQSFLSRPNFVASRLPTRPGSQVYILSVDLSRCYDRINRTELLYKTDRLVTRSGYSSKEEAVHSFLVAMARVISWRWDEADLLLLQEYTESSNRRLVELSELNSDKMGLKFDLSLRLSPEIGLPQGLVAGGFLANLYLSEFDEQVTRAIRESTPIADSGITLHDYARYVDDMRFVLSAAGDADVSELRVQLCRWLQTLLDKAAPGQLLNPAKLELRRFGEIAGTIPVAETMQRVQSTLSGPLDIVDGQELLSVLAGLLMVGEDDEKSLERLGLASLEPGEIRPESARAVAELYNAKMDVRRDTLERFAANRWKRVFRDIRLLAEDDPELFEMAPDSLAPTKSVLDQQAFAFARYLVRQWIGDPSRVLLLKIALDLYPSQELLEVVVRLLAPYIISDEQSDSTNPVAIRICQYVAADLFRAGATETGLVEDTEQLPRGSHIDAYREALSEFALTILRKGRGCPWYLVQQAVLYLSTTDKRIPDNWSSALEPPQRQLHILTRFVNLLQSDFADIRFKNGDWETDFALTAVAQHVGCRETRVLGLLNLIANSLGEETEEELATLLAIDERLALKWWSQMESALRSRLRGFGQLLGVDVRPVDDRYLSPGTSESIPVSTIISRPDNPLGNEVAGLRCLNALAHSWPSYAADPSHRDEVLDLRRLNLVCADWNRLIDPSAKLGPKSFDLTIDREVLPRDPRYAPDPWSSSETRWREDIGRVVRAIVSGRQDFTEFRLDHTQDRAEHRYFGIRSSWYKRKHGLFLGREGLGGAYVPVSEWFASLVGSLMGWLPTRHTGLPDIRMDVSSPGDLITLIEERLAVLGSLFGQGSQTLVLPFWTRNASLDKNPDRPCVVALVPATFPSPSTFQPHDLKLDDAKVRATHRRHLRSLVRLVYATAFTRATQPGFEKGGIDLVVLPELSLHERDLPVLRSLIWKLKCIVFVGRVYHELPDLPGNLVNTGLWILPDYQGGRRRLYFVEQGKAHPTDQEQRLGIRPYRPCQWLIEDSLASGESWKLSGSICYDATDLMLASDLRNLVDGYIVSALNQDVGTFDTMVASLNYHMFCHVILCNSGEFGGSAIQAPYAQSWRRVLLHNHGKDQTPIGIASLHLLDFRPSLVQHSKDPNRETKTPPAGITK